MSARVEAKLLYMRWRLIRSPASFASRNASSIVVRASSDPPGLRELHPEVLHGRGLDPERRPTRRRDLRGPARARLRLLPSRRSATCNWPRCRIASASSTRLAERFQQLQRQVGVTTSVILAPLAGTARRSSTRAPSPRRGRRPPPRTGSSARRHASAVVVVRLRAEPGRRRAPARPRPARRPARRSRRPAAGRPGTSARPRRRATARSRDRRPRAPTGSRLGVDRRRAPDP